MPNDVAVLLAAVLFLVFCGITWPLPFWRFLTAQWLVVAILYVLLGAAP